MLRMPRGSSMAEIYIETPRTLLRGWREADAEPFHAMFVDPRVMEFLGPPQTLDEVRTTIARLQVSLAEQGYWFWAMENRVDGAFMGFCGVKPGPADTPIADKPEIGWRMAHRYWGQGFARETAQATIDWCWHNLDDPAIYAITVLGNTRSWGLMERLGMVRQPDMDFDHPNLPAGDPLLPHITYKIDRPLRAP